MLGRVSSGPPSSALVDYHLDTGGMSFQDDVNYQKSRRMCLVHGLRGVCLNLTLHDYPSLMEGNIHGILLGIYFYTEDEGMQKRVKIESGNVSTGDPMQSS